MIGNVTCGASFSGLGTYLMKDPDRVAWTRTRHLASRDVREVVHEMRATANLSSRCMKPVYHVSLSFAAEDQPTSAHMEAACDAVLQDLGLQEHQVQMVAHNDTAHPHVHMMINRVHPETGKAWSRSHDYRKIEHTLRRLEKQHGYRRVETRADRSQTLRSGEVREAYRTGEVPFVWLVREVAGEAQVSRANSWGHLARRLQKAGLYIEARPRGMVFTDGYQYVAASRVSKALSRYQLERRYGQTLPSFLAGDRVPAIGHPPGPCFRAGRYVVRTGSNPRDASDAMQRRGMELLQEAARRMAMALFADDDLLRGLYVEVRICEAVQKQEAALLRARQSCLVLRQQVQGVRDQDQRIADLSRVFDRELGKAYVDSGVARAAFETSMREHGLARATQAMQSRPETFGAVLVDPQRRWRDLVTGRSRMASGAAARRAGTAGRRYHEALRAQRSTAARTRMQEALASATGVADALHREVGAWSGSDMLHGIRQRLAGLSPAQVSRLRQALGPGHSVLQGVLRTLRAGRGGERSR